MEYTFSGEEQLRFAETVEHVMKTPHARVGVGQLAEKKLHLIIKLFYQPDISFHEHKVGSYVADAITPDGIVEVQNGSYGNLKSKLEAFSRLVPVTVVCPIPHVKYLSWIDSETGAVSSERKSPKLGRYLDAFWELAHIRTKLLLPNVTFRLLLLDVREYRYLNGWSHNKKRGSTRAERVPIRLCSAYDLATPEDYAALLPANRSELFTVKELSRAWHYPQDRVRTVLYVMEGVGAVVRDGKRGNAILYRVNK